MTNIFIIHGSGGTPQDNWFPWLKSELEKQGHHVIVPQFPTPGNQTFEKWLEVLKNYEEFLTPETIFVGHSLGATFILKILEKFPAKAIFSVAGFIGKLGNEFDEINRDFVKQSFDREKIKQNCKHFEIFHSDNDPYIKLEKAEELARFLGIKVTLMPGAGHINESAGYTKFPLLLEKILATD
ncbi:serine hydrolase family protein [Candidatus Peregrinibacteria bacterium]|nr:serine hydrolase family protein [Candidatus Peregrinibacteria bacterium]